MTINRDNFEAYLLDYLEGNLDPLLVADLMAFLAENPEFENLIPESENTRLNPDSLQFERKDLLLKDFASVSCINAQNIEEFCIAECEGLLSSDQSARLHIYLKENPEAIRILETYRKIKLTPDLSVTFADKQALKKSGKVFGLSRFLYTGLAIAASLALVIVLVNTYQKTPKVDPENTLSFVAKPQSNPKSGLNNRQGTVESNRPPIISESRHQSSSQIHNAVVKDIPVQLNENVRLTSDGIHTLKPKTAYVHQPAIQSPDFNHSASATKPVKKEEFIPKARENETEPDNLFAALVSKVDIWKTAESAITGFNHLTESQLTLNRVTDDNGNTTRLTVNTERYSITGKVK